MNKKAPEVTFLDDSTQYKAGVKGDYDAALAEAKRQELINLQKQEEKMHKQKVIEKINSIKNHAIPFKQVCLDFKISLILVLIACFGNIILSIIYKTIMWSNMFNFLAVLIIFLISKHLYIAKQDETSIKINQILKQNICQVSNDLIKYKLPILMTNKIGTISDIVAIASSICFVVFPAQNILYATCTALCLLLVFVLTGLQMFTELKSHLNLINKCLLVGIVIKAIYSVIATTHFIQIDYMNIILIFLFTGIGMWLNNDEIL